MKKNKGKKFENTVKSTIGSGNLWFNQGDLHFDNHCVECKFTDKKSYSITLGVLEKLWSQSLNQNKEPLLVVGVRRNDDDVFILTGSIRIEKQKRSK